MTFEELERNAKVGDLVFFSGRRAFSWLIRIWSGSMWSHVGVVVYAADEELGLGVQIVESLEGSGVHGLPLSVWCRSRGELALGSVSLAMDVRAAMARHVALKRGCRYASPWQFVRSFSLFWSRLHRLVSVPDDHDPARYFCSELAAEAIYFAGVSLPKSPARMTPGDVAGLPFVSLSPSVKVPL